MFRIKYLAAALTICSSSAMAAADFEGFYGQLGVGYESNSPSTSISGSMNRNPATFSVSESSSNSFTGNVGIGYVAKIADKFLLGFGGDYSPIKSGNMEATGMASWRENGVPKSSSGAIDIKKSIHIICL